MKDILHFTHQELMNKFPELKFELLNDGNDHVIVKVIRGKVSNSVSIGQVIHHYWHTYQPDVAKRIWFDIENHTLDDEHIVSEQYQTKQDIHH